MGKVNIEGVDGKTITIETGLFIKSQFLESSNTLDVENPTSGQLLATIACAHAEHVDLAVAAAKEAFETTWKSTAPQERGALLGRLADLISRDGDELASLEALDIGVSFSESRILHISQSVDTLRYFAGWADKVTGKLLHVDNGIAYTSREPIGVCGAIVPWNAPLMITCWKLAPAIATGNALVIKTPEYAPLFGQKLASLIVEAGFPPGVINILCGEGKVAGQALASHMDVHKIAFTGSTATGRAILRASADSNLKKVTLELGGKSPSIVFEDADFRNAVFWTTLGITANNGQVCAAGSRIYVQSSIYDNFLREFSKRSKDIVQGDPILRHTTKGPLVNSIQHGKVKQHIENAIASGGRLLHGGNRHASGFIENTAFFDVEDTDPLMQQEIFGPVVAISKFENEDEVIKKANNSLFGLSAAVFTKDMDRAQRLSSAINAGQIVINAWGALNVNTPFGGVKQSGFGRDLGEDALDGWTNLKTVKYIRQPAKL